MGNFSSKKFQFKSLEGVLWLLNKHKVGTKVNRDFITTKIEK